MLSTNTTCMWSAHADAAALQTDQTLPSGFGGRSGGRARTGALDRTEITKSRAAPAPATLVCRPQMGPPESSRDQPPVSTPMTLAVDGDWTPAPAAHRLAEHGGGGFARAASLLYHASAYSKASEATVLAAFRGRVFGCPLRWRCEHMDTPLWLPEIPRRGGEAGSSRLAQSSAELTPLPRAGHPATLGVGSPRQSKRDVQPAPRRSGRVRGEAEPRALCQSVAGM